MYAMAVGAPIYWGLPVHYFKGMEKKRHLHAHACFTKGYYVASSKDRE